MRNRGQLWDEIKTLDQKYEELYQKVRKLEDDAFLNDRVTKESLTQFKEIYAQIEDMSAEKLKVFKEIYEVSKQTDLYED